MVKNNSTTKWWFGLTSHDNLLPAVNGGSSTLVRPTYSWNNNNGTLAAYDSNGTAMSPTIQGSINSKVRILIEDNKVSWQYKIAGSMEWTTHLTEASGPTGSFHPTFILLEDSSGGGFTNPRISNPQYDNWFIQHPIPQSDLRYAWINNSYDNKQSQPFGYVSDFTVPSGSTSMTASTISFTTASCWGLPVDVGTAYHNSNELACTHKVNFSQYSFSASLGSERSEGQPEHYK